MVTPGLAKLFEKAGVQLIALDAGARALAREAASEDACPQVVLMNGAPPAAGQPLHGARAFSGQERFELIVNAATHPYLDGHRITGAPVIPAALVMEWFLRAATASFPALVPLECRDVKVLRGVPVDGYEGRGVRLAVEVKTTSSGPDAATVEARLVDEQGKNRYFAVVALGAQAPAPPAPRPAPVAAPAWPWSVEQAYATHLFHRGPFAAIRSLGVVGRRRERRHCRAPCPALERRGVDQRRRDDRRRLPARRPLGSAPARPPPSADEHRRAHHSPGRPRPRARPRDPEGRAPRAAPPARRPHIHRRGRERARLRSRPRAAPAPRGHQPHRTDRRRLTPHV
jgi:hypothetical protein